MAYLLIIIVVAVAGITRLSLQQRREHKLNIENDYRSSLQKVATQPLATGDDGPRRRFELAGWTDKKKSQAGARANGSNRNGRRPAPAKANGARRPERRQPAANGNHRSARSERQKRSQARRWNSVVADDRKRNAEFDWYSSWGDAPQEINLERDIAPSRLPTPSRRSQPSARGQLRTDVHATIHPAHLPPPPVEYKIDLGAASDVHDPSFWSAWEDEVASPNYDRRVSARRRAG